MKLSQIDIDIYKDKYKGFCDEYMRKELIEILDIHHMHPLSLGGHDRMYNSMYLWRPVHIQLHNILNIPQQKHTQMTRELRKKTNHLLIDNVEKIRTLHNMQVEYYKNLYKLPKDIVLMHDNTMFNVVQHWQKVAKDIVPVNEMRYKEKFGIMHEHERYVQEKIAIELRKKISSIYYKK